MTQQEPTVEVEEHSDITRAYRGGRRTSWDQSPSCPSRPVLPTHPPTDPYFPATNNIVLQTAMSIYLHIKEGTKFDSH